VAEDGADEVVGLEGLPEAAAALGDDLAGLNQPSVPSSPGGVTSDGASALNEPCSTIWRATPTR